MKSEQMLANEKINESLVKDIFKEIVSDSPDSIGFIGLGFKPGTSVITEGLTHKLMKKLKRYDCDIHLYDNLQESYTNFSKEFKLSHDVYYHKNVNDLVDKVDVMIYCNNDKYKVKANKVKSIDPWRVK